MTVFLDKVAHHQACNVIKERLQHRCFTVNFAKWLKALDRTPPVSASNFNSNFVTLRPRETYIHVFPVLLFLVFLSLFMFLIEATISHKKFWDSLYFHEKVLKNVRLHQIYIEFPLPAGSILCQVWKSYARLWWPSKLEMTKQTCNQHWIRRQDVQVSLFLWLTVGTNPFSSTLNFKSNRLFLMSSCTSFLHLGNQYSEITRIFYILNRSERSKS